MSQKLFPQGFESTLEQERQEVTACMSAMPHTSDARAGPTSLRASKLGFLFMHQRTFSELKPQNGTVPPQTSHHCQTIIQKKKIVKIQVKFVSKHSYYKFFCQENF